MSKKQIYIGIGVLALAGLGIYLFGKKSGTSTTDTKKTDVKTDAKSPSMSNKQKQDWIVANAKNVYGIDKKFSLDKLNDAELTALYVMGAAMAKYGKVMAQTPENFKKVKDEFGVDVSSAQFKTDAMNAMSKLA